MGKILIKELLSAVQYIFLGFLLGIIVSNPAKADPASPEVQYKQRIEICRFVGEEFGKVAEMRDRKVDMKEALQEIQGDNEEANPIQLAAIRIVYERPALSPYNAAYVGYGYCMSTLAAAKDQTT